MKTTTGSAPRVVLVFALLLLAPASAFAQKLANGWYEVRSNNLSVRDYHNRLVMGTLFNNGRDKFYIRHMNPTNGWAWGYAKGVGFEGCGWVITRFRLKGDKTSTRTLHRGSQPAAPPACAETNRRVAESKFAWPFKGVTGRAKYINKTPRDDGASSSIQSAPVNVYGNYRKVAGKDYYEPLNELLDGSGKRAKVLNVGDNVYWRYFTRDEKYVMVRYGGTGKRGSGLWGFIKCENIRPRQDKARDDLKFYCACPAAKRPRSLTVKCP